jgi:hypothetical protein
VNRVLNRFYVVAKQWVPDTAVLDAFSVIAGLAHSAHVMPSPTFLQYLFAAAAAAVQATAASCV